MPVQLRRSAAAALALGLLATAGPAAAADPPITTRLDHVGVRVADIDRSIRFYTDNFGFRLVRRGDYSFAGQPVASQDADITAAFVGLPGSSAIELIQFRKPMGDGQPAKAQGAFHLGLYMKDVRAAYARLSAAGVRFTGEPRLRSGSYAAAALDPDGNVLELIEEGATVPGR